MGLPGIQQRSGPPDDTQHKAAFECVEQCAFDESVLADTNRQQLR